MRPVFKKLRIRKIERDFKIDIENYIYPKRPTQKSPLLERVFSTISRRLNTAFIHDIISIEYISIDCYLHLRKSLFSGSGYTKSWQRLDRSIAQSHDIRQQYFVEILRKKCEIDLFLINSSTPTS